MKYVTRNAIDTIKLRDAAILSLTLTPDRLTMTVEGAIVKANNTNNARFEDMYCPNMQLTLDHMEIIDFCRQGYKYYNADGALLNEVPDRTLSEAERRQVLGQIQGANLFYFDKNPEAQTYLCIFDIEKDDEVTTYQIELTFEESIAGWDRYSGPVGE